MMLQMVRRMHLSGLSVSTLILWLASETRAQLLSANTTFYLPSHCPRKCGEISFEYPFGIGDGCFYPGLDLTCNYSTNPPKLFLGTTTHEVTKSIQLVDKVVHINTAIVTMSIAEKLKQHPLLIFGPRPYALSLVDVATFSSQDLVELFFNGNGPPYLWVIGCSVTAILFDMDTNDTLGSCTNPCNQKITLSGNWSMRSCYDDCCTIFIGNFNIQSYGIKLIRLNELDFVKRNATTIKAFISNKFNEFEEGDLNGEKASMITEIVARWYINDQPSCAEATKNQTSYACRSTHSDCNDKLIITNGFLNLNPYRMRRIGGYRCSCLLSYKGNPYLPDGCEDTSYSSGSSNNCTTQCGGINIPYPFGLEKDCYRDTSFALLCNHTPTGFVPLFSSAFSVQSVDPGQMEVSNISIELGQMEVKATFQDTIYIDQSKSFAVHQDRGVILQWVIDYQNCKEARKNMTVFACRSENSLCWESNITNNYEETHTGYRCNCSTGYGGNPYVVNGCRDIDECRYPDIYICHGTCNNTIGSYNCTCEHGMSGDPTKGPCIPPDQKKRRLLLGVVIGFCLGIGMLLMALNCTYICWNWKKRKQKKLRRKNFQKNHGLLLQQLLSSEESSAPDETRIFTQTELEIATGNFDSSQILGHGGHGTVYKGILSDQRVVAIKKSKIVKRNEIDQFINEVAILSRVNHRNVVKLFGCCLETEVPLLVFEFISNGTLYDHLHNNQAWLPWSNRLRIATEVSEALAYLHSAANISIFHRDVKSSNILLDDYYTAKVSDFGASRSIPPDKTHVVTTVQGTFGYLDPEYYQTGQLTEKSDVYSFGVILLELLTGKTPISKEQEEHISLSMQFLQAMQENCLLDFVDAQIRNEATEEELDEVFRLADICLKLKGSERPTMKEVEHIMQGLKKFTQRATEQQIVEECQESTSLFGDFIHQGTRNFSLERR